jgi:putative ribosome biogenesis GTPase RsgA
MNSIDDLALMFVAGTLTGIGLTLLAFLVPDLVASLRSISQGLHRGRHRVRFEDNPFGP